MRLSRSRRLGEDSLTNVRDVLQQSFREGDMIRKIAAALSLAIPMLTMPVQAEDAASFPSKQIKIIATIPAGNLGDVVTRLLGEHMSKTLNTPVYVENKPGGDTMIGAAAAAESPPNGYTLVLMGMSTCCIAPVIHKDAPYDPVKSFVHIAETASSAFVLVASAKSPYTSVQDVIDAAKANPGKVTYASESPSSKVAGALFAKMANIKLRHVPYKGSTDAANDVSNAEVDVLWTTIGASKPQIDAGRLRVLGAASKERMDLIPNVPVVADTVPGFEFVTWIGLSAPAGTPRPIVDKLNDAIQAAINDPVIAAKIAEIGQQKPRTHTVDNFQALVLSDIQRFKQIIPEAGL
jgi:tripartite-type tricarboxylate transporter receptor subunit TctC